MHAADLARRLGIPRVLVPPLASTLSAFGMLAAEVIRDYTLTVMLAGDTSADELDARLDVLAQRGRQEVEAEGVPPADIHIERYLDVRYRGQSYELLVPFKAGLLEDFHRLHGAAYGYARPEAAVEIVNLRVRAIGAIEKPVLAPQPLGEADGSAAIFDHRDVVFSTGVRRLLSIEARRPGQPRRCCLATRFLDQQLSLEPIQPSWSGHPTAPVSMCMAICGLKLDQGSDVCRILSLDWN